MFQVTFSEQSLSILEELSRSEQLEVIERMSSLGNSIVSGEGSNLGKFSRKGNTIYRMRFGDLRIYFEKNGPALHCLYMLEKNSVQDFLVRCKIPSSEEAILEKHQSFWDFLEHIAKK